MARGTGNGGSCLLPAGGNTTQRLVRRPLAANKGSGGLGGAGAAGRLSRQHCLPRAEEAAWSHPSSFPGQQHPPSPPMQPHKSLQRKAPEPRFPVTEPHLLHHRIGSRGASDRVLQPRQRPLGSSTAPDSAGTPHHQHCKSTLGRSSTRAPSRSARGAPARPSLGQTSRCTQPPNARIRHTEPCRQGMDQHPHPLGITLSTSWLDPAPTHSARGKMLPSSPPQLNQP